MIHYFDLLDKPYKDGERGPHAYDCYGLVMEMFRRDWGIEIADYPTPDTTEGRALKLLEAASQDWLRLDRKPSEYSWRCAVTFLLGREHHIGYMIDHRLFIHTLRGRGVGVDDIRNVQWKDRVTGFYQWKGSK